VKSSVPVISRGFAGGVQELALDLGQGPRIVAEQVDPQQRPPLLRCSPRGRRHGLPGANLITAANFDDRRDCHRTDIAMR
jgi:hypothetical protein